MMTISFFLHFFKYSLPQTMIFLSEVVQCKKSWTTAIDNIGVALLLKIICICKQWDRLTHSAALSLERYLRLETTYLILSIDI